MLLVLGAIVGAAAAAILLFRADQLLVILSAYFAWVLAVNILPWPRDYFSRRHQAARPTELKNKSKDHRG
jgi:hypothetical protein